MTKEKMDEIVAIRRRHRMGENIFHIPPEKWHYKNRLA